MYSISNVSPQSPEETLASLRIKLLRDSPPQHSQDSKVSTDYAALQTALKAGNAAEAETDFSRLQRDTLVADPSATPRQSGNVSSVYNQPNAANGPSAPVLDASA